MDSRWMAIENLITLETDYCKRLETTVFDVIQPLEEVLDKRELYSLFSTIEVIYAVHLNFQEALSLLPKGDTSVCIGNIFLEHLCPYFCIYKVLFANQPLAHKSLNKLLQTNQRFKESLDIIYNNPQLCGLQIESFFNAPVSKACNYPMLLRYIIRSTPDDHPDYQPLFIVLQQFDKKISDFASHTKITLNLYELNNLQTKIIGLQENLITAKRVYVTSFCTQIEMEKEKVNGVIHILKDIILITQPNDDLEVLLEVMKIENCKLTEIEENRHCFENESTAFILTNSNKIYHHRENMGKLEYAINK